MASQDVLSRLRDAASATIARNLRHFGMYGGDGGPAVTVSSSARRPTIPAWNIPAKLGAAGRIADDEKRLHVGHHNDLGDAERHAEWSQRMADDLGPAFSTAVGIAHEIQETPPSWLGGQGQPLSEMVMDLHNNAEGVRASRRGRAIDPQHLMDHPLIPSAWARQRAQTYQRGR